MAQQISRGVQSIKGVEVKVRTVPPVSPVCEKTQEDIPDSGDIYVTKEDLKNCSGLMSQWTNPWEWSSSIAVMI